MSDKDTVTDENKRDYRDTISLPKTDFPMRAGLPQREPEWLERWESQDLYQKLRDDAYGREKFTYHDGPPYANGDIHMGHAMQKTLKDIICRTQQMQGKDTAFIPGWDCHGLPIEWKIEEKYRKKKMNKDDVDPVEFRRECREFAAHWIDVQKEQFKRLGIVADWDKPYTTMAYDAEATIVEELLKFSTSGALYRGSKPVMWSPVEKTALAEAEVEYHDYTSTQIDVAFDVVETKCDEIKGAKIVIWTTTPWTIPANRAICYGNDIDYILAKVKLVGPDSLVKVGELFLVANDLIGDFQIRTNIVEFEFYSDLSTNRPIFIKGSALEGTICAHPWRGHSQAGGGYDFDVPLLAGDHVTTEAGTGFVHTAPGHGEDDYKVGHLQYGIPVPQTVNGSGCYFDDVPLVAGKHVYKIAPEICELLGDALLASSSMVHSYPHSWRSKAPLIFRNTPQWFISMEKTGLRDTALNAIRNEVNWFPARSQNRIEAMVRDRPDWVISRQRAWGVPITVFVHKESDEILVDADVNDRIVKAFKENGADAWITMPAQEFLGDSYKADDYEQVTDILDVWFDSGCTHAFVTEKREELSAPADLYIEGTDQHRGWFQSSLLESCGTRGHAPYKNVLTHGFVQDKNGRKMSKSLGNVVSPQKIIKQYGADILRLWVVSTDYTDDVRIGDEIMKGAADAYRKIRNTMRFMLGNLNDFDESERLSVDEMPELEQYMLHRLYEMDAKVKKHTSEFDLTPLFQELYHFCLQDMSAFYFDIRKDSLYCDAKNNIRRRAARTVLDELFKCMTTWFAPILAFTCEEVWVSRYGDEATSVHLQQFRDIPANWHNSELVAKWDKIKELRGHVTSVIEPMRRDKVIGSSLQVAVVVAVVDQSYLEAVEGLDMKEIFITSSVSIVEYSPARQFAGYSVIKTEVSDAIHTIGANTAEGEKCDRCWMVLPEVADNGDLCNRCADAVKTYDAETA